MDRIHLQCGALVAYMRQSREQLLVAWRQRVEEDPELTTASATTRAQFIDSIPKVLDAFEQALGATSAVGETTAELEQREGASEHGLHRWQQGYDLRETLREWAHLHQCILAQLETYAESTSGLEPEVLRRAREALVRLCGEGACESAARYNRLQQAEAAGRMRDLEAAVKQLRSLGKERGDILRQAAHDLRGSVGVITNASAVLARTTSEEMRVDFFRILDRAIDSTQSVLGDLIDLTRLEAGQDRLQITYFDASDALRDLSESLRAEAAAHGLFLKTEGPETLMVRGDRVKLRRIVQNLALNAIKATGNGGVQLSWQAVDAARWRVSVEDTGPGLRGSHATALTHALSEATDQAHETEPAAQPHEALGEHQVASADSGAAKASDVHDTAASGPRQNGEGIGLSIVKRLCELLGAAIELETEPGVGTRFRLTFPVDMVEPGSG